MPCTRWILLPGVALCFLSGRLLTAQPSPSLTEISFPTVSSPVLYGLQGAGFPVRSGDDGRNWLPLWVFVPGSQQRIRQVAVQPDDPTVVYAATTLDRGGVWKSTDSGQTWARAAAGLPTSSAAVEHLTVAANNPRTLYARVAGDIYRSTDGAASWQRRGALPAGVSQIGIAAIAPTRMYAMVRGGAMFRSDDDGASWQPASRVEGDLNRIAHSIKIDPRDPNIAFVQSTEEAVNNLCQAPGGGLWRTLDGGANWRLVWQSGWCNVSAEAFLDLQRPVVHLKIDDRPYRYCRSVDRGDSVECLAGPGITAIDPRNGNVLFGSGGNQRTTNGGLLWQAYPASIRPSLPAWEAPIEFDIMQGDTLEQVVEIRCPETSARLPFRATAPAVPWLRLPSLAGTTGTGFRLRFDATSLALGAYQTSFRIDSDSTANPSSTVPLRLTVRPRLASSLRFAYSRLAAASSPRYLARDGAGNLYFHAFTAAVIQRLNTAGNLTTVLGTGVRGDSPDGTPAAAVQLDFLGGLAADPQGVLYYGENVRSRVRTIRDGVVRTLLSSANTFGVGVVPQPFGQPRGMIVDAANRLVVCASPGVIRFNPDSTFSLIYAPTGDQYLADVAEDAQGNLYFADSLHHRVYRFARGSFQVIAGTGTAGYNGDGRSAVTAQLNRPTAVDVDAALNVYIADASNRRVRVVTPDGMIFTAAGSGELTGAATEGADAATVPITPDDLLVLPDGDLIVATTGALLRLRAQRDPAPTISGGAMRNAASGAEALSPGSLFSLYGSNLAATATQALSPPWPTTLGGVSVLINGRASPLYYVSGSQINGQVPYETALGPAAVQVRSPAGATTTIPFEVSASSPGILQFGERRAVIQNPDGTVNTAENPAPPESVIVVYVTGLGEPDPSVPTGAPAPAEPLARPTLPFRVTIGDREADVLFLGLVPGLVGLGQANVKLPPVEPGTYPIRLTIGDATSNAPLVTIGP